MPTLRVAVTARFSLILWGSHVGLPGIPAIHNLLQGSSLNSQPWLTPSPFSTDGPAYSPPGTIMTGRRRRYMRMDMAFAQSQRPSIRWMAEGEEEELHHQPLLALTVPVLAIGSGTP